MAFKHTVTTFAVLFIAVMGTAQKNQPSSALFQKQIVEQINEYRASIGRSPLKELIIIDEEAVAHSRKMAQGKVPFGHDGFDGRSERVMKKLKNATASAENVAYSSSDAKGIVDMWLHSPGHKKNIEGDYNLTGIGVYVREDGVTYCTQMFFKAP